MEKENLTNEEVNTSEAVETPEVHEEVEETSPVAEEVKAEPEVKTRVVDSDGNEKLSLNSGEAAFVGKEKGLDTQFGLFKQNVPVKVSKEASEYLKETFGDKFIFG